MDLTLAAFYGSKPDPLIRLVDTVQHALHLELGPLFFPYALEQVHATIIGLEGWREGMQVFNTNALQALGESSVMDLQGLFLFMQKCLPCISR